MKKMTFMMKPITPIKHVFCDVSHPVPDIKEIYENSEKIG